MEHKIIYIFEKKFLILIKDETTCSNVYNGSIKTDII